MGAAADCAFLALASFSSSLWYLARLGFYSDDWELIETFRLSPAPSLSSLLRSNFFIDRPAQGIYSVALYRFFGLNPLGYHCVNGAVLASTAIFLYLALRRLQPSRGAALAVALVYSTLPNYSTGRFWFAAFAAPLSMSFYLTSLLGDLHAVERRGVAFVVRRGAALVALVVSTLLYETALPLFFLNPFLAWWAGKRGRAPFSPPSPVRRAGLAPQDPPLWTTSRWLAFLGLNAFALLAIGIFKAKTAARLRAPQGMLALVWSIASQTFNKGFTPGDYGLNLRAAFNANYVDYFFRLPQIVWLLQRDHPHAWLPVLSIVFAVAVFLYVKPAMADLTARQSIALVFGGLAIFVLGYAIFFTNRAIQITPTGVGNRTSNAAALGVAITAVGMLGLIAAAFPRAVWRRVVFGGLIAAYAAAGFFVVATLSSFWIDAYTREQEIVADITSHVDQPASKSILLVGGICPYNGPAIVFESDWDLAGALRLHYGDRTLGADVLRPGFYRVTPNGIVTLLYGGQDEDEFGPKLLLYDLPRKKLSVLADADTAARIFREQPPDVACPPGGEGVGVKVF